MYGFVKCAFKRKPEKKKTLLFLCGPRVLKFTTLDNTFSHNVSLKKHRVPAVVWHNLLDEKFIFKVGMHIL